MSSIDGIADEMQVRVRRLAIPGEPGESIKSVLGRVSRRAGVSVNEAKRLWYREWRRVPADIADRIREAQARHEQRIAREIEAQKARYWALTHQSSDPEFYGERAPEIVPHADDVG